MDLFALKIKFTIVNNLCIKKTTIVLIQYIYFFVKDKFNFIT